MKDSDRHQLAADYFRAKEEGKPFAVQYELNGEWVTTTHPTFERGAEWRRKPAPREVFLVERDGCVFGYSALPLSDAARVRKNTQCKSACIRRFVEDTDWTGQ